MRAAEFVSEKWSAKYKRSINCNNPKGFSQRAHCQGRKKNEDLNEFAPTQPGGGNDYLRVLASAWYNDVFNTGDLHKGIKSQEDVERILERGVICPDGKKRKFGIGYNHNFDGVVLASDDYYEYDDGGVDSRTNKPWGPYEYIEYAGNQLDEHIVKHGSGYRLVSKKSGKNLGDFPSKAAAQKHEREVEYFKHLKEFAPGGDEGGNNNPEDVLFRFAKMWYSAPDVATQRRVEQALAKIGWEIGELESDEGGAFVMRAGDDTGDSYLAWSEEQLAQLNELSFRGSQCTKDCSGHRAGYEWSTRKGGADAASWSPSFNKGAWLHNNGF